MRCCVYEGIGGQSEVFVFVFSGFRIMLCFMGGIFAGVGLVASVYLARGWVAFVGIVFRRFWRFVGRRASRASVMCVLGWRRIEMGCVFLVMWAML